MTMSTGASTRLVTVWKTLAKDLEQNVEQAYGTPELSKSTGENTSASGRVLRFFRGLGLVTYRSEYATGKGGQKIFTTRLVSVDDGVTAIYKHFDAGRNVNHFEAGNAGNPFPTHRGGSARAPLTEPPVVVADERSTEEVRAIAGPEPEKPLEALRPLRKADDAEALIEAARQYMNRTTEVSKHIEALRSLGVEVDVAKVMEGVKMTIDPTLETISIVVPFIDRILAHADKMAQRAATANSLSREATAEAEGLRKERDALKAANGRLSARIVNERGAATAQA